MKNISIARFDSHYATRSRDWKIETILKEIRTGNTSVISSEKTAELAGGNSLRHATELARFLLQKGNRAGYDEIKKGLSAFAAQGRSSGNTRQIDVLSGYVILEYDDVEDPAYAMALVSQNPYVRAAFVSMSGTGIKIIGRATPVPDIESYKLAWYAFALMFEEIGDPDPSGMRVNQLNALTYDPNLYENPDALLFAWDAVDDADIEEAFPKTETTWKALDALPPEYQVAIENMDWKDDGTGRTRLPCFTNSHENDGWESSENAMVVFRQDNGDLRFHCHKCSTSTHFSCGSPNENIAPNENATHTHIPFQPSEADITALIAKAPPVEVRESASFRHFSTEERIVVRQCLDTSPDAGWHGSIPIWTPKYQYLHPLTSKFALNGQPSEIEKRRVWLTLFGECEECGGITAKWIDRYLLTAGYYCNGCHADYPLGSYLEIELNRKLPNSIISEHQGFLGDNPDFEDFKLFQPRMLTHLGAGMGTGKTTEIEKFLVMIARQGLGRGIIAVPRVALAQQLLYKLRRDHGHDAWGIWAEGISKHNKFIGDYGAIVCLPSLPQAVAEAEEMGIGVDHLYIAVDELDFGYELLSLKMAQATAIKKILRDALKAVGLVVAGQTESTLALEAFAQEMECEEGEVQGFYNTATAADGQVALKKHAADTNINAFLASGIDDITEQIKKGQNVYAFCTSRRDGEILADEFSTEHPVFYNAYTKGTSRAHELLRCQRLTDSKLFIGTSAAGVGISFLDQKAVTVVLNGLIFGSRHANMAIQESIRDRGRRGVLLHYKDYNFSLPVRPTERRDVSIYHEELKKATDNFKVPTHAIMKIAAAKALASLADTQFPAAIKHHLGTVGNMEIIEEAPTTLPKDVTEAISSIRAEMRKLENESKKERAKAILNSILDDTTETELLTSAEIRRYRNLGRLTTDDALGNELANEAARAVGWDDTVDRFGDADDPFEGIFDAEDIEVALALVERNFDFKNWENRRDGYLAAKAPNWTAQRFEREVSLADRQLVMEGFGVELHEIKDYRLIGELIRILIDTLRGQVFETQALVELVNSVLATHASTGKTYGQELRSGAFGANEYRKARFLHCAEDAQIVNWVADFIETWYPARLSKRENFYGLQPDTHADLYLRSFERWLLHQSDFFDKAEIKLDIFKPVEMPESNPELKKIARERREKGETLEAIAKDLGFSIESISNWCEGITPKKQTKETRKDRQNKRKSSKQSNAEKKQAQKNEAYRLHTQEGLSFREIGKLMRKNVSTISRWMEEFKF